jgi:hypothetical protein
MANKHPLPIREAAKVKPGEPINHPHESIPHAPAKIIHPGEAVRGAGDHYGGEGKDWDDLLQIPGAKRNTN